MSVSHALLATMLLLRYASVALNDYSQKSPTYLDSGNVEL